MAQRTLDPNLLPLIKVVGVSGSGKSTLVHTLRQAGYNARPVSQEHSSVSDLWAQFDRPTVLIYLYVDTATQAGRRPEIGWTLEALRAEEARLAHARDHADLRINTSELTSNAVAELALAYLKHKRIAHAPQPLAPLPRTGSSAKSPDPPS